MRTKNCEACACLSLTNAGEASDVVYTKNAIAVSITLCHLHSIELFKIGQNSFLTKYGDIFQNRSQGDKTLEEASQDG